MLNGKKSSYYDVISSLRFNECNVALAKIYSKVNLDQIYKFIDNDVLFISDIQRTFYRRLKEYDKRKN